MFRLTVLDTSSVAYAAGAVLCTLVVMFVVKLYVRRSQMLQLKRQGWVGKSLSSQERLLP